MTWCFSTRASVATVLGTHQCISSCLWVNVSQCFSTRASAATILNMHLCISSCLWVNLVSHFMIYGIQNTIIPCSYHPTTLCTMYNRVEECWTPTLGDHNRGYLGDSSFGMTVVKKDTSFCKHVNSISAELNYTSSDNIHYNNTPQVPRDGISSVVLKIYNQWNIFEYIQWSKKLWKQHWMSL